VEVWKEELTLEMRGLMGGFYRISEWILRFSVINILWILCSIPFFFLIIMLIISQNPEKFKIVVGLLAIVAPFTLFPATSALFTVARKWVMGEGDVPLLKTFFKGYKENYLQSITGGLIYTLIAVTLWINYRFYLDKQSLLQIMALFITLIGIIWFVSLFHFFSFVTHYHMKLFQLIKNSILITIVRPVTSVLLVMTNIFIVYISTKFTFLIPFFMGSLIAFTSFWFFYRIFLKKMGQQEKGK
jgi:uncharacterized membrane protein YesL